MACRSAAVDRRSEGYILEREDSEMVQATIFNNYNKMVSLRKLTARTKTFFQSSNTDSTANDPGTGPVRRRTLAPGQLPRPTKQLTIPGQHSNQEAQRQNGASRGSYAASNNHADELMRSLDQILEDNKIGMNPFGGQRDYLSDRNRKQLITKEAIKRSFPDANQPLVDYIHDEASKTFTIVLRVLDNYSDRLEAMEAFQLHGFNDGHLPVPKINLKDCLLAGSLEDPDRHMTCSVGHEQFYNSFHHSCWVDQKFAVFRILQKNFMFQTFNTRVFQYDIIKDDCFLPFLPTENEEPIPGGFGTVYPARMPVEYLDDDAGLFDLDGKEEIKVAIKVLNADPKHRYEVGIEWSRESYAHQQLNGLDPNLINAIASFRYKNSYCLLLEWADGGSLDSFWKEEPNPKFTREGVVELLDQLVGLAKSLHAMHNKKTSRVEAQYPGTRRGSDATLPIGNRDRTSSFESYVSETGAKQSFQPEKDYEVGRAVFIISPPATETTQPGNMDDRGRPQVPTLITPDLQSESDGESTKTLENWRHGDVKPANILRFKNKGSWLGTLKLADLGRAKQRQGATQEQRSTEIDLWRSKAHEAPDIHVDPNASMSRLYDSWSFGTVIFDIIVWMLYGRQSLHNFAETTAVFESQGSPYWTRHGDSAEVSTMTKLWISHILRVDAECNRPEGTAMGDLMKLVRDELLIVKLPNLSDRDTSGETAVPGRRSNAARLLHQLEEIRTKARSDAKYLFTENDRSNMSPPPSGNAAVPEIVEHSSEPGVVKRLATRGGLLSPESARDKPLSTRQRQTYTHDLKDMWHYEGDDDFATHVMGLDIVKDAKLTLVDHPSFCGLCRSFEAISIGTIRRKESDLDLSCSVCEMLADCAKRLQSDLREPLTLVRDGGSYIVNCKVMDRPGLRVCREPQSSSPQPSHLFHATGIPVGLPRLPSRAGDNAHVAILKAWLDECDNHGSCVPAAPAFVPKRLLHVGLVNSSKVVETAALSNNKTLCYLALSHPWGKESPNHRHFKSNRENIKNRMTKIKDIELPLNFRHAVQIARRLGVNYLWIDSICILQKTDTDPGDFHEESKWMESIYASAYCVIAASSAEHMSSGFLGHERDKAAVQLHKGDESTQPTTFLCDTIDDFQGDVLNGPLSKRGWVLQERALARRTIFFTNNQTYWECSQGIRCETLSKLTNKKVQFLGDSNFPSSATTVGRGAQEFLFEQLYEDYTRLEFSQQTDKAIGISGLEQRLTRAIGGYSGAGMFSTYWGRCLLWKRDDSEDSKTAVLKRIPAPPNTKAPPSWSWMAYEGGMSYLHPPKGLTTWNEKYVKLQLTGTAATSWLYASKPLKLSASLMAFDDQENTKDGDYELTYDNDDERGAKEKKCVIIGSVQDRDQAERGLHYILVVKPPTNQGGSDTWERIGAGKLHGRFIQNMKAITNPVNII